jgi:hypothetical protein
VGYRKLIRDMASSSPRRQWSGGALLPVAAMILLACVCFSRLIAHPRSLIVDGVRPSIDFANRGDPRPVGNDLTFVFLPQDLWIARIISTFGHLPFWDARGFGGRPLVGNPQAGMFYPPVWLAWFGAPSALGWLTVAHLVWGGLGAYVLVCSFAQSRWSATVAGGVYLASPFLLAHTFEGHYPHVWEAAWYPWAFWAMGQARVGRSRGRLLLPAILALAFLAGHPQEWLLLALALSIWGIADALACLRAHGARPATSRLCIWGATAALSLGLTAIELAPQLGVWPWLLRDHDAISRPTIPGRYHLEALNGFQLLTPTALGGPSDYFGHDNYWETLLSIGLVPLLLAALAVLKHPDRRLVRAWFVLLGLSLWFACGRALLLYTAAYFAVPGMSWCRVPARSLFLANLGGAVLAGLGVQTLATRMADHRDWRRFAVRCGTFMIVIVTTLYAIGLARHPQSFFRVFEAARRVLDDPCFRFTLGGLAALLALGCVPFSVRNPGWAGSLIGVLAFCELGWHGNRLLQVAPAEQFVGIDPTSAALAKLELGADRTRHARIKARDNFYSDLSAVCSGFEKSNINDVFQIDHAARLYKLLYPVASRERMIRDDVMSDVAGDFRRQVREAVFDRMGVAYLVSDREESDPRWPVAARGPWNGREFVIQSNLGRLPLAYVVPTAMIAPSSERFDPGQFLRIDPRRAVLMDSDPLRGIDPNSRQPFTPVEWICSDPDRLALIVTTSAPGLLVVADTWMPGWSARVDGLNTEVLRGNHAQRVVPLRAAGRHTITLDYRPTGYTVGFTITAASLAIWLLLCALAVSDRVRSHQSVRRRFPGLPSSDDSAQQRRPLHQV